MSRSHALGRKGETLAREHLRREGWSILGENWRFHHKEIDLVAERDGVVAFIEVKTRSGGGLGHPLDAVTGRKRRDLAIAARGWIALHGRSGQDYRFDAISVVREGATVSVHHVADAWRL